MKDPQVERSFALHRCEADLEADLRSLESAIEQASPHQLGYRRLLREWRVAAKLLNTVRLGLQLSGSPEDQVPFLAGSPGRGLLG
jgi:hypothetical protein